MKITQRGPTDADLSQRVQSEKAVSPSQRGSSAQVQQSNAPAQVNISNEARQLQRVAELARRGDELRSQKVSQVKEQIANGQYQPDSKEISKSIVRAQVSDLLQNS